MNLYRPTLLLASITVIASIAAAQASNTNFTVKSSILGSGQNNSFNDIRLEEIIFTPDHRYQTFIGPSWVGNLQTGGNSWNNNVRVLAGKNGSVSDKVMVLDNKDGWLQGQEVSSSTFNSQIKDAFSSRNINHFVDIYCSDPCFRVDLKYDTPLSDKIFVSERGTGGSNSKMVLEALDASGKVVGTKLYVDPKNRVNTNLYGATYTSSSKNPTPTDQCQLISFYAFDVAQFGVSQISGIRVSTPKQSLGSGQDYAPDFRVMASAAPVPEPGTMLVLGAGAAFFAARRRIKKA